MPKTLFFLILLLTLINSTISSQPMEGSTTLNEISWLLGTHSGAMGEGVTTETWTQINENMFEGKSSYEKEGKVIFSEYLQIQNINGNIVYIAVPQGQKPVLFNLMNTDTDKRVSFENEEHDFPKKIIYEKESGRIKITLQGKMKDKDVKEEYYIQTK